MMFLLYPVLLVWQYASALLDAFTVQQNIGFIVTLERAVKI